MIYIIYFPNHQLIIMNLFMYLPFSHRYSIFDCSSTFELHQLFKKKSDCLFTYFIVSEPVIGLFEVSAQEMHKKF